jgi:uncharacterized membrane protein YvbJ
MICPRCGVLVNDNNSVCWNCNHNITSTKDSLQEINEQKRRSNLRQFEGEAFNNTHVERNPIENKTIVTTGDWIVTLILLAIPVVNCIMPFIWAFSSSTPLSKKNFAKAFLIIGAISFVLIILFWSTIISMIFSIPGNQI